MPATLDSRQLLAFATLAESKSFTLAAKQLFLTQSAISHSIKNLENDIGCKLFERVGKKTLLSEAGEKFLPTAQKILSDMETARQEIDAYNNPGKSRIRIGTSNTVCQYFLPAVLKQLKLQYPECSIHIESVDTPQMLEAINQNQIDTGISIAPEGIHSCKYYPLFTDELRFIAPTDHPWAIKSRVNREEFSQQNFLIYSTSSYTFRLIKNHFEREDTKINRFVEIGSMEAIKEMVKIGMGIGILAPWTISDELSQGSLVTLPLGRRKLVRNWGLSFLKGKPITALEKSFLDLCEEQAEQTNLH